jgi:hypothetical protein
VALLGMITVHVLPDSHRGNATWWFGVFGGRAAAAFAVLAGIGIAFVSGRHRVSGERFRPIASLLATRAALVGAIGLALGFTDASDALVILPYYAVLFLFAIPLVTLRTRAVAATGVAVACLVPVLTHLLVPHLPSADLDNPGFGDVFSHPLDLLAELTISGEYPALAWVTYLCAGIVVGRLDLSKIRNAAALLTAGLALNVGTALTSSLLLRGAGGLAQIWAAQDDSDLTESRTAELLAVQGDGTTPASSWWWLAVDTPHTSTFFDLMGTTGSSCALLGAMLLLGHVGITPLRQLIAVVRVPLAAAGAMPLTLYVLHVLFMHSELTPDSDLTSFAVQAVLAIALALVWRATGRKSPLEGLITDAANAMRDRAAARTGTATA